MPNVGPSSSSLPKSQMETQIRDTIANAGVSSELNSDVFTRGSPVVEKAVKNEKKNETIENAKRLVQELSKKKQTILRLVEQKKNAIGEALNSKQGVLQSAIHYGNRDLVSILSRLETAMLVNKDSLDAPRMTNEEFLTRCLKALFGPTHTSVTEWLAIETRNHTNEEGVFNLRDLYRKWLAQGKGIYEASNAAGEELEALKNTHTDVTLEFMRLSKPIEQLQENIAEHQKKKEKIDNAIGALVLMGKENQVEVNRLTRQYLDLAIKIKEWTQQKKRFELNMDGFESDLEMITVQISEQQKTVEAHQHEVHIYENRLALVETLLGHDIEPIGGNDLRVRLIKNAISKAVIETTEALKELNMLSERLTKSITDLTQHVEQHDSEKSLWDQFWLRRRIKKLVDDTAPIVKQVAMLT